MKRTKIKKHRLLPTQYNAEPDVFTDRLPLEELKKIWGAKADRYTDKQLYKIRDFSYVLCEVIYSIVQRKLREEALEKSVNEGAKLHQNLR